MQLQLAGDDSGSYAESVLAYIAKSPHAADIKCLGRVSNEQKIELMRRSHVITVTSVKEGWGLIVTEAASQGTPAVVYDADGLRDSVKQGQTGTITVPNPPALAGGIVAMFKDKARYETIRVEAWRWSTTMTFDHCYEDFIKLLKT